MCLPATATGPAPFPALGRRSTRTPSLTSWTWRSETGLALEQRRSSGSQRRALRTCPVRNFKFHSSFPHNKTTFNYSRFDAAQRQGPEAHHEFVCWQPAEQALHRILYLHNILEDRRVGRRETTTHFNVPLLDSFEHILKAIFLNEEESGLSTMLIYNSEKYRLMGSIHLGIPYTYVMCSVVRKFAKDEAKCRGSFR